MCASERTNGPVPVEGVVSVGQDRGHSNQGRIPAALGASREYSPMTTFSSPRTKGRGFVLVDDPILLERPRTTSSPDKHITVRLDNDKLI